MTEYNINRNILWILVVIVLYSATISTINYTSTAKIGYIESNVLMEKFPAAIQAREKLSASIDKWGSNTKKLEEELNVLNNELFENDGKWNKKTKAQKNEEFKKKQKEYVNYTRAISEKQKKLEVELFEPVYLEINEKISEFGNNKGFEIILGTVSGGNILFAEDATNLTNTFLEFIKS